ncbi:MAG TPA: A24 family peptidase [Bryobacteraceae bacterium]|nr:A24 family peptidase [Bryobacteraceae bacterium]
MDARTFVALTLGCIAAVDDLRRRVISNWISLGAIAAGLIWHTVQRGWTGLAAAAGGAALGFAVFLVFYCLGGMGGGDLKLMAAFGALLGPQGILLAALLASIIGGLMAAASLIGDRRRRAIPYAPAIVLGAWLALLAGR